MRKLLITIGLITGAGSLFAGPIHDAVRNSKFDELEKLINQGANVNARDSLERTPLFYATWQKKEYAELLISKGADVNALSVNKKTPLHLLFENYGSSDKEFILTLLLLNGADVNAKDRDGVPPLHLAVGQSLNATKLLIAYGADLKSKGRNGEGVLHQGIYQNEILNYLIEKGADINARDNEGKTPLMNYAERSYEMTDILLNKGADVSLKDNYGLSVLDQRLHGDSTDLKTTITLLRKFGAKSVNDELRDDLNELKQKVEQGSAGNTNPTDEWPRKMWEIDLGYKITSMRSFYVGLKSRSFILSVYGEGGKKYNCWIDEKGAYYELDDKIDLTISMSRDVIYFDYKHFMYFDDTENSIVLLSRIGKEVNRRKFKVEGGMHSGNITFSRSYDLNSSRSFLIQRDNDSKITGWDFTPPTLASTDNEGGNNGGNTTMSRLSIGTSGPDISIATDGKLGGPAELQKSNDLKNWRKLGDVPADSTELLITPRDSGNEFFRLKRVGE